MHQFLKQPLKMTMLRVLFLVISFMVSIPAYALTDCGDFVLYCDPGVTNPPPPPPVSQPPVTAKLLPVNFYIFCRDPGLSDCAYSAKNTAEPIPLAMVSYLNFTMNQNGTAPMSGTTYTGFKMGSVTKIYLPPIWPYKNYYDVVGSVDPSDGFSTPSYSVNVFIVNSSTDYAGIASLGQSYRSSSGGRLTIVSSSVWSIAINTSGFSWSASNTLSHEIAHVMGMSHLADSWGGTGNWSKCGKSYSHLIRKIYPWNIRSYCQRNIMNYEAISYSDPYCINGFQYEYLYKVVNSYASPVATAAQWHKDIRDCWLNGN